MSDSTPPSLNPPVAPPAVEQVLRVFRERLPGVQFPDVDVEILESLVQGLEQAERKVQAARQALSEAEHQAEDAREALLARAGRAVAYAKIYADSDPGILAELELIQIPRIVRRAAAPGEESRDESAPRRRGRPPKSRDGQTMNLTLDESAPS